MTMASNDSAYGVVLTTVSSQEAAKELAQVLLTEKLAACINIMPVESFYSWQGTINCDREWQLIIKTHLNLISELTAKITAIHDYEVPEIIALPIISGSNSYLQWLGNNLK